MYVTIEVLLAFCALIVDLIALVVLIFQNNKKK
ncbi:MAG: putative holin-like toxin [Ruminococcaceae bacterium]|nr:putative holin-like toxin [Oscillospiraceae bacterium]